MTEAAALGAKKSALTANNKVRDLERNLQNANEQIKKLTLTIKFMFERFKQLEGQAAPAILTTVSTTAPTTDNNVSNKED